MGVRERSGSGTFVFVHSCVRAELCKGTVIRGTAVFVNSDVRTQLCSEHSHVRAESCSGTVVYGYVWSTVAYGHGLAWAVMFGHGCVQVQLCTDSRIQ